MVPPSGLQLAACLVNVSCGRRPAAVARLAAAPLRAAAGSPLWDAAAARRLTERGGLRAPVTVLSVFPDTDYDRTVYTVAGPLATLGAGVLSLCREACELVDLRHHAGNHPCLGAVDLVPFHPLSEDVTLEDCARLARAVGDQLTALVPGTSCFWFGEADPLRRSLPLRRRQVGWFQRRPVAAEIDRGTPDPRLGVTGIGAIPYMTNYNVTLDTADLAVGREVAAELRATAPGGMPGVQAMAFVHGGRVEVACNLDTLPSGAPEPTAVEARVRQLAAARGAQLTPDSRVVGFTRAGAARAAWEALSSGDGEAWRLRRGAHM
ncbi:glutamate formimidoyltransferase-like [Amphibalanus amphitrite]|uniref:glutamate formimidoyltransferase-like n=1 Tax=Amphibalanus amphitrite TaxID=1232801 RepID=UPI001C9259BD|nr:glutamate formimidoyltransferase-like [Amphibalanus amphitrite]